MTNNKSAKFNQQSTILVTSEVYCNFIFKKDNKLPNNIGMRNNN